MNNTRKKILYVAPHLSTGGLPQYLLKQIEHFYKDYQIKVVEVRNSGGDAFVVQKNKIKALVPVHTLYEDKSDILKVIDDFEPDIIHFQEIPQHDLYWIKYGIPIVSILLYHQRMVHLQTLMQLFINLIDIF